MSSTSNGFFFRQDADVTQQGALHDGYFSELILGQILLPGGNRLSLSMVGKTNRKKLH